MFFSRKKFLSKAEQEAVINCIRKAERHTSGEIRVHMEPDCKADPYARGLEVFAMLGMHKTAQRNGVLFYVAYEDKKFSILGDEGINNRVPADFWVHIKDMMRQQFKQGNYAQGLCEGIEEAGKALQQYFPYERHNDRNELTDDISFGGRRD